ncbi:unnamed protein product [Merluccius merluccius]
MNRSGSEEEEEEEKEDKMEEDKEKEEEKEEEVEDKEEEVEEIPVRALALDTDISASPAFQCLNEVGEANQM